MPTPSHWRRGTAQPKKRSPSTATTITPVASTAWTIESGAIASAAACRTHAPTAIAIPAANHLERISAFTLRSGRSSCTASAAFAPRCLHRKPSCVAIAQANAIAVPRFSVKTLRSPS